MDFGSKYIDIKEFLSISDEKFTLKNRIDSCFDSDNSKIEILGNILDFIYKFSMFRSIEPFMNSVYTCIEDTLELNMESTRDFNDLLIKTTIMKSIQNYIDYTQLSQKTQILKVLSDSLDKLQLQPLIINLGLLLKPMYKDKKYMEQLKNLKEQQISYTVNNEVDRKIKGEIDHWLNIQNIELDNQEYLRDLLKKKFDSLANKYHLSFNAEQYNILLGDVMEMLTMKLTMVSLMEVVENEPLESIPLKY